MAQLSSWMRARIPDLTNIRIAAISTLAIAGVILGVRHLGWMQPLELVAYDQMKRSRPDLGIDPRLLVVTITDEDLRSFRRWPISDRIMAQVFEQLQKHQPRAIGLDIYRDIPVEPGNKELMAQLKKTNVIAIRNIDGTAAPPDIAPKQIGFNDLLIDPDGIIRRQLLVADTPDGAISAFSFRLARLYLKPEGITLEPTKFNPKYFQLGKAVFIPLAENSGGYQNVDARGYQALLDYRTGNSAARQVSLQQVLKGDIEPDWVRDKVVLIGSTAPSLKDYFYTSYSPAQRQNHQMAGVFIHAQMVSQYLDAAVGDRPLFSFWSEKDEILWILGWVLVGGALGMRLRHPLMVIFGSAGILGVLGGASFYIFSQSIWIPVASPALGFVLTVGLVVIYRSYIAQQQQQIVMRLLGQNTSPEIAKDLWNKRDYLLKAGKLPGIRLTATVMFSDIRNFSTISEQKQPEELLLWLNELLDVITHEVLSREGIINKFTGDGVMAVFGVPMSRIYKEEVKKDAQQAVECAMAIAEKLAELNRSWKIRGMPEIQMRLGMFTGPVVVGSLGGKDRLEYGVIGDTVNIASRLESCEKHLQPSDCRILTASETLMYLEEDQFDLESWGPMALKGRQQTVDVYRVVGRKQAGLSNLLPQSEKSLT